MSASDQKEQLNYAGTVFERFLAPPELPARRPRGRPKKSKAEKQITKIINAAIILAHEGGIRRAHAQILAGERTIPQVLADEKWFMELRLRQVGVARVLAKLFGTEVRTEENKLAKAHSLYRTDKLVAHLLKNWGVILPSPRPFIRKKKIMPTA
jgi:hypothetical protein